MFEEAMTPLRLREKTSISTVIIHNVAADRLKSGRVLNVIFFLRRFRDTVSRSLYIYYVYTIHIINSALFSLFNTFVDDLDGEKKDDIFWYRVYFEWLSTAETIGSEGLLKTVRPPLKQNIGNVTLECSAHTHFPLQWDTGCILNV